MKRSAAFFPIVLAFAAIVLAPRSGAQAQSAQEGPIEIEKCQTISQPGSYRLVRNLTAASGADCLVINADFVTIDLAGFTISGPAVAGTNGILARQQSFGARDQGLAVRNGSIQGFNLGVNFIIADGVIVEGLRVAQSLESGIQVGTGIVRGNTVVNVSSTVSGGIAAGGTVTGNFSGFNGGTGFLIAGGSLVIGNTATNNLEGIVASCPSDITDNTFANNSADNLRLVPPTENCNVTNNVAP